MRLRRRATTETVDVRSLGAAFFLAAHDPTSSAGEANGERPRMPSMRPGEIVPLYRLELVVAYISERIEHAAAQAVELGSPDAFQAVSARSASPETVLRGLSTFVLSARRWLDAGEGTSEAWAEVEAGSGTISAPDLLHRL